MVVPVDDNETLHLQLRSKFFDDLKVNGNYNDYEDLDLERLRNDDNYCKRFILHKKGNFEAALLMVGEALKWRKSFGVKDVTQASIPLEFFQAKAVFPFNKDKEGNPIIMILVRFHKKAPEFAELLRKFVIYWVELMEEQTNGGQMTVIMSCVGAGISNLDLDLIKFLITLFRSYYPHSLAHILIFEMPWILNPAWKIIKAWLPEDFVEKIKFVNRASIQDYVSEDNLPVDMGGTDTTEYVPPTSLESDVNSNNISTAEPKRIANGYAVPKHGKGNSSHILITDDYTIAGGILKICPASELCFSLAESSNDVLIKLTCVSEKHISYKVKTNNIESYRVKPSIGIIEPGNSIEINVILLQDFHPLPSDKFLIMAMEISDPKISTSELNALWKSAKPDVIADHKLKCIARDKKLQNPDEEINIAQSLQKISSILSNIDAKVQSIHAKQSSLQFQLNISLFLTVFLFLVVFIQIFFSGDSVLKASLGFI